MQQHGRITVATLTGAVSLLFAALPPAAGAAGTTLNGPASAPRGTVVTLSGEAEPGAHVDVFFRTQGTSTFVDRRDARADDQGRWTTTYSATVDYELYASSGGAASAKRIVRAVGTTINAPGKVRRGSSVTLRGLARPGLRVDVLFRSAGTSQFVDRRDLVPNPDGTWATTYTADKDYQVYARTAEGASARPVVVAAYATISGPSRVPAGSTVVLTGTARPNTAVAVWFRKAGTTTFVQRRNLTATSAGTFRTSYYADASHAYYAIADGVQSATGATNVPPPPPRTFGSGTHRVGSTIAPGTYRTRQAAGGCYWERLSGFSGEMSDVIANDFTDYRVVVTIASSDAGFKADGCGTFTSDLSAVTTSRTAPFSNGTWIVGTDIAAGTWRAPGGSGCYWERLSGFSGETTKDVITNGFGDSGPTITIAATDRGFHSSDCGSWQRIG